MPDDTPQKMIDAKKRALQKQALSSGKLQGKGFERFDPNDMSIPMPEFEGDKDFKSRMPTITGEGKTPYELMTEEQKKAARKKSEALKLAELRAQLADTAEKKK